MSHEKVGVRNPVFPKNRVSKTTDLGMLWSANLFLLHRAIRVNYQMSSISIPQVLRIFSKQAKIAWLSIITPLVCCSFLSYPTKVTAQLAPDNTLPNNTVVSPNGNLIDITGGARPGNGANLFHSFQDFSVKFNETVRFRHNSGIENIINRVTGGSISNIDGTIQTLINGTNNKGNANLFIINPNGIIFGANAKLDIGGSFFASTADSIKFTDGSFYSAVNPQEPPLLTVNVPLGLQYNNSNPGDITVQGDGNNLSFDFDTFATVRDNRPAGLQVASGKTLALVGGDVNLDGGNLTAKQGRIEIGSVQGEGLVTLKSTDSVWNLDYTQANNFGDINLINAASVDVGGNAGGDVQVIGRNISLFDGSAILGDTLGNSTGGTINIKAAETLKVIGFSFDLPFSTRITSDVGLEAKGNGGRVEINAKNLIVADGGQIGSGSFGSGNGGVVDVKAENIELIFGGQNGPSGLFTTAQFGRGNGGAVIVETDNLLVQEGARIASQTFSEGNAGNVDIKAKNIQIVGTAFGEFPSTLSTTSSSPDGSGGNIKVKTDTLSLVDGATIESSTFGSGNAGGLDIQAKQIEISGASPAGLGSAILTNVEEASGDGGLIEIKTQDLLLLDGGQISTAAFGSGNGGTLKIKAEDIVVSGFVGNFPSGLFSSADVGRGGNLIIDTTSLLVNEGGQISTTTFGTGNAGNLNVKAQEITLSGFTGVGRSSLLASAIKGTGDGGKLTVKTDKLTINNGATVSTSNFTSRDSDTPPGQGKAGDIEINASYLELDSNNPDEPASINASTFSGGGGHVTLNVDEVSVRNGSQIIAEARGSGDGGSLNLITDNLQIENGGSLSTSTIAAGNGGIIDIQADNIGSDGENSGIFSQATADSSGDSGIVNLNSDILTLSNAAAISTSSQGTGNAGIIKVEADKINLSSNGQITTNSTGLGQAGNINILFERLEANRGEITATSQQTGGGDITLTATASEIFLRNNSLISTSVLDSTGGGGNINIIADIIAGFENSDISANAVEGNGGNIDITTRGIFGLEFREQPTEQSDITASSEFGINGTVEINNIGIDPSSGLVELPAALTDSSQKIATGCSRQNGNSFVAIGRGGMPQNPSQSLNHHLSWSDLRNLSALRKQNDNSATITRVLNKPVIVEATGFIRNQKGEIELVAARKNSFTTSLDCNVNNT
ncbi:hypothetical protein NIES267_06990 [Calothrix parasitica NIES-267]|uniref:Filamentous haemagglutinin FhaB/tRNA nuclease CdiA-like TPS domain-containing protein n=1 Tax=Calothrix parasitica NIES-267 TaxID=1973488 RepID=A0A1Z4LJ47_9CYAN|nr:hypothetical protein NIES267_06990 [Calothrix parasitica NIES-267]